MPDTPQFTNSDNALLWSELQHINESLVKIDEGVTSINGRVRILEVSTGICEERWSEHKDRHKTENVLWGAAISIMTAIATAIGVKSP